MQHPYSRARNRVPDLLLGMVLALAQGSAASLTVCGVVDQSPGDTDPAVGAVQVFCATPGGGFFNGRSMEMVTPTVDTIVVSGTFTGAGSLPVSNTYPATFVGGGTLTAAITGSLESPGFAFSEGGESFALVDAATTFSNNSAMASATFPNAVVVPAMFAGSQTKDGIYGGAGTLFGTFTFNAGARGRFSLPASGLLQAAVPEASTLILFGIGSSGLLCYAWFRRRRTAV